ncbi:MAG: lysoplasmalogenase [Deltaproteobacteria bacterium]|nr:lysoplasmalogenase [Deltaproteobacteria bacterium]MBW2115755.1 lysoplasmalogenase [Deltaproteobacteria bacterium]MBW2358981.1 lysoplasmalogenase [Deltaproteobacteria bacterium]
MKRTNIILTLLAVGSAILFIWAEYYGPPIQIYIFKPLTMVFILVIAVLKTKASPALYAFAIIAGLVFSMAGDIFLMLPSDQFILGLVSFLIAHLFYITAFTYGRKIRPAPWLLIPFVIYGILIYGILSPYLGVMKLPVAAYIVVILIMGWRAWERWSHTTERTALLAFLGAVLFIISDSILALNRFREPFEVARALNLSTYFAAQWLITLSISKKDDNLS